MKQKQIIQLERKIVIGMIQSTKFLKQAAEIINTKWVQSREAKILMNWVLEYFAKYKKAPQTDIQDIYMEKLRANKIQKKQAELIEFILSDLSDEDQKNAVNIEYLIDQTELYGKACKINLYAEQVQEEVENGNILEAEHLLVGFKPVEHLKSNAVVPLGTIEQRKNAFSNANKPVVKYPGALGQILNQYMVPESFVVFLGQNKGGKSFWLMDAAMRAAKQGKNVIMIQAGDMSQAQQERRQGIYLAKKSDLQKYSGLLYLPVLDCVYNQNGACEMEYRQGGHDLEGPFETPQYVSDPTKIQEEITYQQIMTAFKDYPDHIPCYNCLRANLGHFKGAVWYKRREPVEPLGWKAVHRLLEKKYKKMMNRIRLSTYSSESLTMSKVNAEVDILEKRGFFADVIIVDYMDLIGPDRDCVNMSSRDKENIKWQRARRLSQDKKCVFISASQSDTEGFERKFLSKRNFSEDRRKLDHVTAMVGLNMTIEEKRKGVMRINDIVARDTEGASWCYVTHRLQIGRPIIHSFF